MIKEEYKLLVTLARSVTYTHVLKPQLEALKKEFETTEPQNEFQTIKMYFQRFERIKVINKIFNLIEGAENQLNKLR